MLLEKPLAPTLAGARRLVDAIEVTEVRTAVNFTLRSDPRYQQAKLAATDGTVGEICTMSARRRGTSRGAEVYGPWTDILISTAIHDIDAVLATLRPGATEPSDPALLAKIHASSC